MTYNCSTKSYPRRPEARGNNAASQVQERQIVFGLLRRAKEQAAVSIDLAVRKFADPPAYTISDVASKGFRFVAACADPRCHAKLSSQIMHILEVISLVHAETLWVPYSWPRAVPRQIH